MTTNEKEFLKTLSDIVKEQGSDHIDVAIENDEVRIMYNDRHDSRPASDAALNIDDIEDKTEFINEIDELDVGYDSDFEDTLKETHIYSLNGIDDLEGTVFAHCTTREKAKKIQERLLKNGFETDIVRDQFPVNAIIEDGEIVRF